MKVAIIGANGQLGRELTRTFAAQDLYPLVRPECDVRDAAAVRQILARIHPDVVINAAAMTHVDGCEDEASQAFDVNALGARNVALACAEARCALVHLSTDYVFGGEQRVPYREDDTPVPLSVYGASKLAGEHFVRALCPRHFVVRTSGLYGAAGARGKGGNFVETMLRLGREGQPIRVVHDQVLTPTYARDVAQAIARLAATEAYGVYHVTNGGACSWYEFAGHTLKRAGLAPKLSPTTSAEWGARARRPSYSVLAVEKVAAAGGGEMRMWTEALDAYLTERGYA